MEDQCPILSRVESLEQARWADAERMTILECGHDKHERTQEKMSDTLESMCKNVGRLADNVSNLIEILPLITTAQAIRKVAVWVAPIFVAIGAVSGFTYWLLGVLHHG